MQLYALDEDQKPIFARHAKKGVNYTCFECHSFVRLRAGMHRQPHFFHIQPNRSCHQSGKSLAHLQVQIHVKECLPEGEAQIEYSIPTIRRIGDVAWIPHRLIFEIQCSPISAELVLQRNLDYHKEGWKVVWIFHECFYNQWKLTAAEWVLRYHPHYYTNIDEEGNGMIYDQFEIFYKGLRYFRLKPLQIHIGKIDKTHSFQKKCEIESVQERLKAGWYPVFHGDFINLAFKKQINEEQKSYLEEVLENEKRMKIIQHQSTRNIFKRIWTHFISRPYSLFFQYLLERLCR